MRLSLIPFIIVFVLSFVQCDNGSSHDEIHEEHQITTSFDTVFYKSLEDRGITFDVYDIKKDLSHELQVHLKGLLEDNSSITLPLEDPIINIELGDLNTDLSPELFIYTQSDGSGSYGKVIAFSVNNGKSVSQVYFPPLPDSLKNSYMGHDEFAVVENTLARRFPIYLPGDVNANPSGGMRQIQYQLEDGEAGRILVASNSFTIGN